jgi:hypothetical protein
LWRFDIARVVLGSGSILPQFNVRGNYPVANNKALLCCIPPFSDLATDLQSRSDAEPEFFLDNSRWPSDKERVLLSARKNM